MIGINILLAKNIHTAILADVRILHREKNVSLKGIMEDENMVK